MPFGEGCIKVTLLFLFLLFLRFGKALVGGSVLGNECLVEVSRLLFVEHTFEGNVVLSVDFLY